MVQLNNEEKLVLVQSIAMLDMVSDLGGHPKMLSDIIVQIAEQSPESAMVIVRFLDGLTEEGVLVTPFGRIIREFLNDALINASQLHIDLQDKFTEYAALEREEQRNRREWFAVECAEKLIEPNTLEELKPIMVKLRGDLQ